MKNKENNKNLLSKEAERFIKSYQVDASLKKEEVLANLLAKIESKQQKPSPQITWYKAAASIAATVLIVVSIWLYTATENIKTSPGETYAFRLPDDSRVVLHDGSSLSYRKIFWNRKVKLSGEAYFEVEKGEGFLVNTDLGDVHVLGTRFLVHETEDKFTVQCYEGRVKTSYNEDSWILEPGTRFFGQVDTAEKEVVKNEEDYPGFAMFSMTFRNMPLPEVIDELEQFFGVDIQLNSDQGKRFSGSIETGSLTSALQIICEPLQLKYEFEDKYDITIY